MSPKFYIINGVDGCAYGVCRQNPESIVAERHKIDASGVRHVERYIIISLKFFKEIEDCLDFTMSYDAVIDYFQTIKKTACYFPNSFQSSLSGG